MESKNGSLRLRRKQGVVLQNRREHGLGTSAVFEDVVKTLDSVPRETLYRVQEKFGIPLRC